jgi:hypothetical protein
MKFLDNQRDTESILLRFGSEDNCFAGLNELLMKGRGIEYAQSKVNIIIIFRDVTSAQWDISVNDIVGVQIMETAELGYGKDTAS